MQKNKMILDRTKQPEFKNIEKINFPEVEKITLDNGIPVYVLRGGTQDVVKVDVMVKAGVLFAENRIIAPVSALMLNEGTSQKSAHEIAELFDFYGAYFQPSVEKDMAFPALISVNRHLKKTLPLFAEVLSNSVFPEKEFNNLLDRRKQKFLIDSEKTEFIAREKFTELLFGNSHPYGNILRLRDYDTLKQYDAYNFYKKSYASFDYSIIASGMVTEMEIALLNQYFGQLTVNTNAEYSKHHFSPSNSKLVVEEKNDAVQSSIRIGQLSINKTHPDYIALKILITILGGYFGSRLMKNIREEKGYTYGIYSVLVSLFETGYISISADVKAEHTADAVEEIKKEINRLKNEPVPHDELELVRNYMMGDMLSMFDGTFAMSESYKAVLQYGFGFEYFESLKDKILTITSEELQDIANKYLDVEKMLTVVAGRY